jgi:hypothetical protein
MDQEKDKNLYKFYLEMFYKQGSTFKEFNDLFDQKFLNEVFEEFQFLSGKELKKDLENIKKYEKLAKQVMIQILEFNPELYKRDERVKISLELKNVPTLYVKIFEFNSENYYRKTLQPFRTDVNLDGLISSDEKIYEFKETPQKKFRYDIEFPELDNKVGLFVIELISNGYSSRAVIKKGSLSLITKSTIAGQYCYILDENREICTGDRTGMWYNNQYFTSDPAKGGRILIPYERSQSSNKAILLHNGFA